MTAELSGLAARWRAATVVLIVALIAVVAAWQLIPTPTPAAVGWALVLNIPLLAPLPGLYRGRRYTFRWATLCVLPYFVIGLTESVANPQGHLWSAGMLALGLANFASMLGFLRATGGNQRAPGR